MTTPGSPVPHEVSAELRRVVDRWHRLQPDTAAARMPLARDLLADLATATATRAGQVPDLGPAAVPDQLTVLLYDACAAGVPDLLDRLVRHRSWL